MVKSIKK